MYLSVYAAPIKKWYEISLDVEGTLNSKENCYVENKECNYRSVLLEGVKEQDCCLNILEKEDIQSE